MSEQGFLKRLYSRNPWSESISSILSLLQIKFPQFCHCFRYKFLNCVTRYFRYNFSYSVTASDSISSILFSLSPQWLFFSFPSSIGMIKNYREFLLQKGMGVCKVIHIKQFHKQTFHEFSRQSLPIRWWIASGWELSPDAPHFNIESFSVSYSPSPLLLHPHTLYKLNISYIDCSKPLQLFYCYFENGSSRFMVY